jgi:hypothetical protein
MTEQKTEAEKKAMAKVMGGEMITVKVELFQPYVEFMKGYLAFFGSKKSLEDLCREIIYEQTEYLCNELYEFADKSHFLETKDWYWKHPYLNGATTEDEETEN